MEQVAIAIDLGGTAIKYGLTSYDGKILWENSIETPNDSRATVIDQLNSCISEVKASAKNDAHIACIGIGTPGLVDINDGIVMGGADQLPDWENLPLGKILSETNGLPVFVDNDANMMGLGESVYGSDQKGINLIFVTIGTCIGGAIIINGDLYRGHFFAGAELGCIPMTFDGAHGNWEDFGSTEALIRRYKQLSKSDSDQINGKYIFELEDKQDSVAIQAIEEHVDLMGQGLGALMNIFNPEKIVVGGGISERGKDYIDRVHAAALKYALVDCSRNVEVTAATLGNKAGFLGAGYFALHQLNKS